MRIAVKVFFLAAIFTLAADRIGEAAGLPAWFDALGLAFGAAWGLTTD